MWGVLYIYTMQKYFKSRKGVNREQFKQDDEVAKLGIYDQKCVHEYVMDLNALEVGTDFI